MSNFYNFFQTAELKVHEACYMDVDSDWTNMVNDFKHVRIYYIRSGSAELSLTQGKISLREGYLYFIPAFSILEGTCKNSMGHYFIHIIPDILTEHFFRALPLKYQCELDRSVADYLFLQMINNHSKNSFYSRQITDSILKLLLSHFLEDVHIEDTDVGKFTKVFEYIDEHIGEKIYIRDLAALVYLDDAYFSNLFKKTFGIPLQQHILQKRVDRAKKLLASDMTISEIANTLGFLDTASFSNFFKKQTSMAPKDFRTLLY